MTDTTTPVPMLGCTNEYHVWAEFSPGFGALCLCGQRVWWQPGHSFPAAVTIATADEELAAWVEECTQ